MADNVTVDNNSLTDYIVSTDEAASGQVQRVKLSYSADGSDTHVTADASGLLVNLGANNDVTITSGSVTVTDGGSTISVDDGGSSLTVDGTVTASLAAGTNNIGDVDVLTMPGTFTEDAAASGGETGHLALAVRKDADTANVGADNDYATLLVDSRGALKVEVFSGETLPISDGGGSLTVDNAALSVTGGGVEATALRVTIASDSTGVLSVDDNGSTLSVDDGGSSLTVDGTVSVSGTVTVDTELPTAAVLADNAANPTVPGVGAFGMVYDGSTWDRAPGTSADGLLVNLGANNDVTVTGTVTANAGTGTFTAGGVAAHDAAVSGNPVLGAGRASTATPTAVSADGDVVYAWHDRQGAYKTAIVDDAGDSAMDGTNNALRVNIVAGGGSGGTSSTDDAAFTAGSGAGTPMMGFASSDVVDSGDVGVVRMTTTRDLMVTLRDSAGDSAMDDANNALRVNVVAGSSGGPSKTDDAAFTIATDSVAPMGALVDETTPDSADEGDVGIPRMTADRKLLVRVVGGTDANRLDVDASGRPTVNVNGTVTVDSELPTAAALADNTANPTTTSVGAFPHWFDGTTWDRALGNATDGLLVNLGANNDVTVTGTVTANLAAGTNNIGDVDVLTVPAPLSTTGGGTEATALRVTIANDSTGVVSVDDNGSSLTVDGTITANQGTAGTAWEVVGDVAQDAAIAGNPLPTGLRASDAEPTAMSADGDAVYAWGDRSGRFVVTQKCGSTAPSSVAGSATSVSLLASNAARLGAVINNDSTAILYVKLGATASTTSYTYKLFQDGVCEIPYGYTGAVDGLWSSATGNARITEFS